MLRWRGAGFWLPVGHGSVNGTIFFKSDYIEALLLFIF